MAVELRVEMSEVELFVVRLPSALIVDRDDVPLPITLAKLIG